MFTFRVFAFAVCLLSSGCANQVQKTLDRAILIEERCTVIEQALPMEEQKLRSALIDAIAIRLVGTCVDGQMSCLGTDAGEQTSVSISDSAEQLRKNLDQQQAQLQSAVQSASDEVRQASSFLDDDYLSLKDDISKTSTAAKSASDKLYFGLRLIRSKLVELKHGDKACALRTDCISALVQQIAQYEKVLTADVSDLKAQMARLPELGQRTLALLDRSALLLKKIRQTAAKQGEELANRSVAIQKNAIQLSNSAVQMARRLENGMRTVGSLFSHDVQTAATDLMAARVYDRGADRLLGLIDRMLSQLDHTIDKVDDHAYGGASISLQIFSGDIQERFDRIFDKLIAERYPNKTAQLAFASAACKRLGMGTDAPVQNASMFSPFLYAALTRVEYEIGDRKTPQADIRAAWEKKVGMKFPTAKEENGITTSQAFLAAVSNAYKGDAEQKDGGKPSAPSMLQQVALCAGVEQRLALETGVLSSALKEQSLTACGRAAMDAALASQALTQVDSQARVQSAIDSSPPVLTVPGKAADAGGTATSKIAMSVSLAAPAPKELGSLEVLCKRIISQIKGSRCIDDPATGALLDFEASFGLGKPTDKVLELQLAQLADILSRDQQNYRLVVNAYASRLLPPCSTGKSVAPPSNCGVARNKILAQQRAKWALEVLKQRMGERILLNGQSYGTANPLSYDTPEDRRLRITLSIDPRGS